MSRKKIRCKITNGFMAAVLVLIAAVMLDGNKAEAEGRQLVKMEFEEIQEKATKEPKNNTAMNAGITLPGFEKLIVFQGEKNVSVDFYNPEKNHCNLTIAIKLSNSGKVVYQSKLIAPGQHLYQIQLKTPLKKGSYEADMIYQAYELNDNTPLNGASMKCQIIVK